MADTPETYGWTHTGQRRPDFAVTPGPGQESVWDYPRPPAIVADARRVIIRSNGHLIMDSVRTCRVLETAGAPAFYVPPEDVDTGCLQRSDATSYCEWKGQATYWDVVTPGGRIPAAVWAYESPKPAFAEIAGWMSCYPEHLDCTVDGEAVTGQPGGYYGGWVTGELVGPFKGEPGTQGW